MDEILKPQMEIIHRNYEDNDFVMNSMDKISKIITLIPKKTVKRGIYICMYNNYRKKQ